MPFHRSLTFWLGLLILAFLVWAWSDSRRTHTSWCPIANPDGSLAFHHSNAAVSLVRVTVVHDRRFTGVTYHPGSGVLRRAFTHPSHQPPWFPPYANQVELSPGVESAALPIRIPGANIIRSPAQPPLSTRTLRIPHWLIITCYLPLWLGLSYWRSSRIKKRLQASLPSPAQPQQ